MKPFTERAVKIIKHIPPGKVMTYGQIAGLAGSPRAARQVVRILHSMSEKYSLPWYRVLNSRGEIGFRDEEQMLTQRLFLEAEGVHFIDENRIDLGEYQYEVESGWEYIEVSIKKAKNNGK
ncbi:MGMT family protein [Rossellomorea arthrocnemi]|jgi:methylated-DNA-protein-cysteine methyltransferase related protein|uniref:MGMT family protein n=1 Tax=Rossellomorea arthrocnemi TaxID=2769542 RepID=UPI00191AEBBE|nr:MGMT family protein [Rossellomorea arthrocnemi]